VSSEQVTGAELQAAIETLKSEITTEASKIASEAARLALENKPPATSVEFGWRVVDRIANFPTSGLFFICLGGLLLKIAYETMGGTLSAFSFVLVVLGIAVLLYGTGTQGMARFQSGTSAGYNVAIAGGAGALAFIAAWGITEKQSEMKTAFNVQKQYTRVPIRHIDSSEVLGLYTFEFSIDGVAVPAMRQGNTLEILVPYTTVEFGRPSLGKPSTLPQQPEASKQSAVDDRAACFDQIENSTRSDMLIKTVRANLFLRPPEEGKESANRAKLEPSLKKDYRIWIMKPALSDGGYDLPKSEKSLCINLISQLVTLSLSSKASTRTEPLAKNEQTLEKATDSPNNPPAADLKQSGTGQE
jgi:hypothetical protein